MEIESNGEFIEINLVDGQTIIFEIRPNETIREFRDRLQESGISINISDITPDGKNLDDVPVLSYFKSGNSQPVDAETLDANTLTLNSKHDEGKDAEVEETFGDFNEVNLPSPEPEPEPEEETEGEEELVAVMNAGSEDPVGMFCAVPSCETNELDSDILLFRFPANRKRCMEWVEAIKREDLVRESIGFLSTQLAVCALHFTIDQFVNKGRKLLKHTAVPSILLNPIKEEANENEVEIDDAPPLEASSNVKSDEWIEENEEEMEQESEVIAEDQHPGSLCRLCASIIPTTPLYIFSNNSQLAEKIDACLPIAISKTDVLPKQICEVCNQRLQLQYSFMDACAKAEKKLIALTKNFIADGLNREKLNRRRNKQTHCCPLCCQGDMRYICKDMMNHKGASLEEGADDSMAGLYSDDADSEPEQQHEDVNAVLDLVYASEDRVFAYECDVCEEVFGSREDCLQHCHSHAATDYYPCVVCGLVFPTDTLLTQHFAQHKMKAASNKQQGWKTVFSCSTCGLKTNTKKNYIIHKCAKPVLEVIHMNNEVTCDLCQRSFTNAERAKLHRAEHSTSWEVLCCLICEAQVNTEKMLQDHVAVVHDKVEHRCAECGLRFIAAEHLDKHNKIHQTSIYQYQCSLCNSTFTNLAAVNKHIQEHNAVKETNEEENLRCNKCDHPFAQRSHLQHHLETAHDSMGRMPSLIQYQCNVCSERFTTSSEVLIHRTVHWKSDDPTKPFVCEYCGLEHASPNALARHRRYLHPDEHPYVCTLCDYNTRTLYEARVHRKTHTGYISSPVKQEPKIFQCDSCPCLFSDRASFLTHKKSHKTSKVFTCDMCNKAFPERHRLLVHKRLHTGERPYKCGTCDKRFSQTSAMYTHSLLHTGELPHSCDLCNRKFRIKSDRDSHRRTHTGEKPFKCPYCAKSFRTGQVFYQHRMIHTGERRYPCDLCDRAFKRSHTLACHRRIHTGEKPNVCDICGKGFRQRTDMRKHKISLHQVPA